jgi:hypothetical protein
MKLAEGSGEDHIDTQGTLAVQTSDIRTAEAAHL